MCTSTPLIYIETYAAMAQVFATQLVSIIVEGVFDACPGVRVAFLESGFTWLPAHLWRMDKEWKNLRRLVPWVRRPPSDYVREHVRIGNLLPASDYPHWDADDPGVALPHVLPEELKHKIRFANAARLYGLE